MNNTGFEGALDDAARLIVPPITLVFHNDADGICSAAIAIRALEKKSIKPRMFCIEKMYPEIVEAIHGSDSTVIYLDMGSGEIGLIEKNRRGNVIIADHHRTRMPKVSNIHNLSPELYGISGDRGASASTISYMLFSKVSPIEEMRDAAIIGATEIPGPPSGLNKGILHGDEAKRTKYGKVPGGVAKDLTILGAVGYHQNGPKLALRLLLNGYDPEIKAKAKALDEVRKAANRRLISSAKLSESKNAEWIFAGESFRGMGVKVIGTFCSYLSHRGVAPEKILLGFMDVEQSVPMLEGIPMQMKGSYTKVSARAPSAAQEAIKVAELPSLGRLMHEACANVNGFGDGHDFAASGVIPRGRESDLIKEIESLITKRHGSTLASYL